MFVLVIVPVFGTAKPAIFSDLKATWDRDQGCRPLPNRVKAPFHVIPGFTRMNPGQVPPKPVNLNIMALACYSFVLFGAEPPGQRPGGGAIQRVPIV